VATVVVTPLRPAPERGVGLSESTKSVSAIYEDLGVEVAGIEPVRWRVDLLIRSADLRER